jgi:cbb3-type cytochrome oxidase subunit 3
MSKISGPEMTSYAGSAVTIGASLTLTQIGVIVGIATALLTFLANVVYMYRKDRREQRESDAALAQIEGGK